MEQVLVTFDVDGTLIQSSDGGVEHINAINKAARDFLHIDEDAVEFLGCSFNGTTDIWLVKQLVQKAKPERVDDETFIDDFKEEEIKNYYSIAKHGSAKVLPGIVKVLNALNEMPNVTVALCTGNFEKIAWKKMESADLVDLFPHHIGGFGEVEDRVDILKNAIKNAEEKKNCTFDRIIHIGDAPQDNHAAYMNNVISVEVETGDCKRKDYKYPCFVFQDLDKCFDDLLSVVKHGKPLNQDTILS